MDIALVDAIVKATPFTVITPQGNAIRFDSAEDAAEFRDYLKGND